MTEKKKIDYSTVRKYTSKLPKGNTKVDTDGPLGHPGRSRYGEVRHNGKIESRKKTATKTVTQPKTQVVLVGTKKPKPKPSAPSVASGSVWDKIAQCESGGNWSINTGNGFYGGLQFTLSTWRAYGGTGMPSNASRARADRVAKKVQAAQGWGAWPAAPQAGLR